MHFRPQTRFVLSWSLLALATSRAAVIPRTTGGQYDFIIVGGGTAGNVVANRLSENPQFQVLVLEAGPSQEGLLESQIPFLCTHLTPDTPYDWNYTTVPQPGLNGRSIPYPRGHILGGSSAVNYLIYTRGTSEDYDRYAAVSGDSGWSWNNLQPYFMKNERFAPPVDKHDTTGQFDPTVHSFTGMNNVSLSGFPTAIDSMVINASQQLGNEFAFNLDQNSGKSLGVGWVQTTTNGPQRSSSATSYLAPRFRQRPNLHIIVGAQVSRVYKTGSMYGTPVFRKVEFRLESGGTMQNLTASREVIISAGSIGTPQILMNSGIGNATALRALGITPLVDLPDVGENLSDHPFGGVAYNVTGTNTFDDFNRNVTIQTQDIAQWQSTGQGLLVDTIASQLAFLRVPSNNSVLQSITDPAAGPNTPHYELLFTNGKPIGTLPPQGHFVSTGTVVLQPTSRGSVKLRSNNPFDPPLIDPGLLASEFDKVVMREAVKSSLKFFTASSWNGYVLSPQSISSNPSDAEIDAYNAVATNTIFHPVGTASMSPRNANNGVVNPDLTVKKVTGLRVVDISVLPFVTSAHTQVPAYIVGERASDLIKAAYA